MSILVWIGTAAIFLFEAISTVRIYDILPVTGLVFTLVQTVIISAMSSIAFANR